MHRGLSDCIAGLVDGKRYLRIICHRWSRWALLSSGCLPGASVADLARMLEFVNNSRAAAAAAASSAPERDAPADGRVRAEPQPELSEDLRALLRQAADAPAVSVGPAASNRCSHCLFSE